jgi:subtilase family serine protease
LDVTLEQAAARGQSLFVSSGDTGVFCAAVVGVNGVPAGIPSVEYPASSPYAVGVGGTSYFESTPTYQANAGGLFIGVNRGVPDVAVDTAPKSGYTVIVNGSAETIGGTSASAASWQGIWARIQSGRGGNLGFANPVLYAAEPARVQRHHPRRQRAAQHPPATTT